jgi:thiamine pyrophosphate-dependent acetolactate synthase large subunit-like protein
LRELATVKAKHLAAALAEGEARSTPTRAPEVLHAVNKVFGHDTILCKENGATDLWCYYWPYYRVLDTYDCVPMAEQTAMGMGVIGAIGAKLARPHKKVICITGDGAMNMAMMELATATERKCGITWVVLNNQALGWTQYHQLLAGKPFVGTSFEQPADFAAIAEAQGCLGIRVHKADEIEPALEQALVANKVGQPALLDISIRKHDYPPHFERVHRARLN